jgi:hypothetical protein
MGGFLVVVLAVGVAWPRLWAQQIEPVFQFSERPRLLGEKTHDSQHFRIHYVTEGTDAVPPADSNADGVPDRVDEVAKMMEEVWRHQVVQLDWAEPPPDGRSGGSGDYDVYLIELGGSGALGQSSPERPCGDNPRTRNVRETEACPSFITLDNNYRGLEAVAAHEFNHGLQFGYTGPSQPLWLHESTAVWMSRQVYPRSTDAMRFVEAYMRQPDVNLNVVEGEHHYGAWLFPQYIGERLGPEAIRAIWETAVTVKGDQAVWQALAAQGVTFPDMWRDFGAALYVLQPCPANRPYCFDIGADLQRQAEVAVEDTIVAADRPVVWLSRGDGNGRLDGQASDYLALQVDRPVEVHLEIEYAEGRGLQAIGLDASRRATVVDAVWNGDAFVLTLSAAGQLMLVVRNGSPAPAPDYALRVQPPRLATPTASATPNAQPSPPSPTSTLEANQWRAFLPRAQR